MGLIEQLIKYSMSLAKSDTAERPPVVNAVGHPHLKHNYSLYNIWVAGLFLKVLLFTTYHSTDFDVHRNWLAITHNLPISQWYYESTSQWTLDYPPFFAYFEWLLSQFVPQVAVQDGCLDIVPVGQYSLPTVFFQRSTVIISEILLFVVLQWYISTASCDRSRQRAFVVASSVALSPGFLIIDHIHFQYNGFLFALVIGSVVAAKQQRYVLCGALFATSLCFKHIFLYLAPAYFVFLLRVYCLDFPDSCKSVSGMLDRLAKLFKMNDITNKNEKTIKNGKTSKNEKANKNKNSTKNDIPGNLFQVWHVFNWINLVKLGSVVVFIFGIAFGPFIYPENQIPQLLTRLFPFSRGLTHAYWAPNIWAIYSFSDRVLSQLALRVSIFAKLMTRFGFPTFSQEHIAAKISATANTKGLVQDVFFTILPDIPPKVTFLLTLFYQLLALFPLFINPTFKRFLGSLTLCGFASFLFGWHVHEKAIMLVIIPFSFLVIYDRRFLSSFNVLISAGYVSLFPLLFKSELWTLKVLYTYVWCLIYFASFREVTPASESLTRRIFFFDRLTFIYIVGLLPLVITCGILDALGDRAGALGKLEFFRLMCISVYCSLGVVGSWFGLSWLYFFDELLWV